MPSFDVTSVLDQQEVRNAVDQASREIANRYDFKGTDSSIELGEDVITLHTTSEDKLRAGARVRQVASLAAGISSDKARELNKHIKGLGLKGVQSQAQGDELRVTAKKRDDLQVVIASLKEGDFGVPLQFGNFRD
jgi:uncharacterized protein YajQ (UPF0234 family)